MKIAVCDDQATDREKLSEYLTSYTHRLLLNVEIVPFRSGEELLCAFSKGAFQLIFLDIYMDGISGVETAFRIREKDPDCVLVFATSSPGFRAEGFDVGAIHYLIKPVTREGVEAVLSRCRRLIGEAMKQIEIMVDRRNVRVRMGDILYAEVYGKTVLIHTLEGALKTRITLGELAVLLEEASFLPCHRCYIVNMRYITEMEESDFVLENGACIPIRKNGRQKTKDAYIQYVFDAVRRRDGGLSVKSAVTQIRETEPKCP